MSKENEIIKTESHAPLSGVSTNIVTLRDFYAAEAMKVFMLANGRHPQMSPMDRIKFLIGKDGWKRHFQYNYENISEEAFKMADLMLKNRHSGDISEFPEDIQTIEFPTPTPTPTPRR